jgi:hypothetical protein
MTDLPSPLDLAYVFAPPAHSNVPGSPKLTIRLRSQPTDQHFDPETVQASIISISGQAEKLKVTHPWSRAESYRVLPGRVVLQDRLGKCVEAFTFGGTLELDPTDMVTTCIITSPAPILSLVAQNALPELLAEEVEILLAELAASWSGDPDEIPLRMSGLEPDVIYRACLVSMLKKYHRISPAEGSSRERLLHLIRSELREAGVDASAANEKTLAELLAD